MDTKRLILFVIFSFSILMLWDGWQREHATPAPDVHAQDNSVPNAANVASVPAAPMQDHGFQLQSDKRIQVTTDQYKAVIDTAGGDLRHLELQKHRADLSDTANFVLLDDHSAPTVYVAQSGLIGTDLPTHKSQYTAEQDQYEMQAGQDALEVKLTANNAAGVKVEKIYTFHRNSYVIDVSYRIQNESANAIQPSVYYQIVHDSQSNKGHAMMPTFTGGAYYTEADKFKKVSFADMAKNNLSKNTKDGWVGLIQHYFVSAWLPKDGVSREFYTKKLSDDIYAIGSVSPVGTIAPGANVQVDARYYAGPQDQDTLKAVAPGLEYSVDYGILKVIATPLFWILSKIEGLVHNWGLAIILLTVLIKLAFFPLSAASYKSMAHMRELAPRLQRLKEQYGDDRMKMQQAMMEIYKTEKINPLGGCLPIIVQIPVFIALYWVLLGTVELRHAPFMLWIHDLSAPDTLFGTLPGLNMPIGLLPLLMGATMIIQTRLNPTPPDPVQAKVMMIMPVVFSVFFFFFPAGLVLYWLVNNILSITQQWYINRTIHRDAELKKKGNGRR